MADHVLVADDQVYIRQMLDLALTRHGFTVTAVDSYTSALWAIKAHGEYDAVVLDFELGDGTGLGVYRELVSRDPVAARRVVFLSGDPRAIDVIRAAAPGVSVLPKPCSIEEILEAVRTACRRDRGVDPEQQP
jgi:two-component system OmpR family response regulator